MAGGQWVIQRLECELFQAVWSRRRQLARSLAADVCPGSGLRSACVTSPPVWVTFLCDFLLRGEQQYAIMNWFVKRTGRLKSQLSLCKILWYFFT